MKFAVPPLPAGSRISDNAGVGLGWFRDRLSGELVAGNTRYRSLRSVPKIHLKLMPSLTQHLNDVSPVTRRARPILQILAVREIIAVCVWRNQKAPRRRGVHGADPLAVVARVTALTASAFRRRKAIADLKGLESLGENDKDEKMHELLRDCPLRARRQLVGKR